VGSAIHDQAAYRRLSERAGVDPAEAYFPAYRRPAAVAADG
jgi:vacuolar-type H+-ATPase catalytic subunit A/Vma1